MGRKIVKWDPAALQSFATVGVVSDFGEQMAIREGLPDDAKLLRMWVDNSRYPDGQLIMLFESDKWPDNTGGMYVEEYVTVGIKYAADD